MTPVPAHRHALGITRREVIQAGYSGLLGLSFEVVWVMEVRRGEPVWDIARIAVLTVFEVLLDDLPEAGVEEEAAGQTVEQRREPGDRCGEDEPTSPHDPPGL